MLKGVRIGSMISLVGVCLAPAVVYAGTYEAEIKTHKATGAIKRVDGAKAMLMSSEAGIAGVFATKNLKPGHIYTMWVAIMNNPQACKNKEANHCTSKEVLKKADIVKSDVTYGDGVVVPADGTATFRTFVPAGKLAYSWLGKALTNPTGAEIHFALHDHGPMIAEAAHDMLTTARGGCTDGSLPKLWPASARASGDAGPNKCSMAQFAILKQK